MAPEKADVVHHRASAGLPESCDRARVRAAGVKAEPDHDVAPPFRRFQQGFWRTHTLIARRVILQDNLRRPGVETDHYGVRPQRQRVAHHIEATGQVERRVRVEGLLDHLRVIGGAVALGAQIGQIGGHGRRQGGERSGVEQGPDLGNGPDIGIVEAVGEGLHHIGVRRGREVFAGFAQRGKDRYRAAGDPFHVDFVARIALNAEEKGRAGDLFEAGVLNPKLVGFAGFERDGRRHAQKMGADERESGFALQDGGFALPFKGRVNHRELPARRGLRSPNAVAPPEEADVLDDVSPFVDAGQCRAETEVHVGEKAVLGIA